MARFPDTPLMGDMVYYFDEDKRPYAAFVAFVHSRMIKGSPRPICNLAIFKHDGRVGTKVEVEPAYFDNKIWKVMNKWAWPDEVPSNSLNQSIAPGTRTVAVGYGETLVP